MGWGVLQARGGGGGASSSTDGDVIHLGDGVCQGAGELKIIRCWREVGKA